MSQINKSIVILTLAAATAFIFSSCTQPRRIFHGGFEVATPMSDER